LGGKVGDGAAGGKSTKGATGDEIEAQGKDAAVFKDAVPDKRRDVGLILEGIEIDGTSGKSVIKGYDGEPGGPEVTKEGFVKCGSQGTGFHCGQEETRKGVQSLKKGAPVKGVGVEVSGHDGWTRGNVLQQEFHLARAAAPGRENLEMRVGNCEGAASESHTHDQGMAGAGASFGTARGVVADRKGKVL
jgi:hypothetical protein